MGLAASSSNPLTDPVAVVSAPELVSEPAPPVGPAPHPEPVQRVGTIPPTVPKKREPRSERESTFRWVVGGGVATVVLAIALAVLGTILVSDNRVSGTAAIIGGLLGIPGVVLLVFGAVLLAVEVLGSQKSPAVRPASEPAEDLAGSLRELTRNGPPSRTLVIVGAILVFAAVLLIMLADGVVTIGGVR